MESSTTDQNKTKVVKRKTTSKKAISKEKSTEKDEQPITENKKKQENVQSKEGELLHLLYEVVKKADPSKVTHEDYLNKIIEDIRNLEEEPLEVIPISHYSISSATQTWQRLAEKKPKLIFLEAAEDFQSELPNIDYCSPPIAFQGALMETKDVDPNFLPVYSMTMISEVSSEFQAMKYAKENRSNTEIIFVDAPNTNRIVWEYNHRFKKTDNGENNRNGKTNGKNNVKLIIAETVPESGEFMELLLRSSNFENFAQWWDEIAENALLDASYETYRQIMVLIGSVFRRLGGNENIEEITAKRDQHMWNKIKQILKEKNVNAEDCVFICGAAHAIPMVAEWGMKGKKSKNELFTQSHWKFGLIQTDYLTIDQNTNKIEGTTAEMHLKWESIKKLVYKNNLEQVQSELSKYEQTVHDKLLGWSTSIVKQARKEGYVTSAADSIAIVELTYLLKDLRGRTNIAIDEFKESAITCIEKNDRHLKPISELLSKFVFPNRSGTVGYKALPALAKDVFDRLLTLGLNIDNKRVHRVLIDLKKDPHLQTVSDLLWLLKYFDINVTPIAGNKSLGRRIEQESWDIYFYRDRNPLIQLALSGMTVEDVFRNKIEEQARKEKLIVNILTLVRDVIVHLGHKDFLLILLVRALMTNLSGIIYEDQNKLLTLTLELLNYFRTLKEGVPRWFNRYLVESYRQFCQEIVKAADDNSISAEKFSLMFSYIFKVESIALAEGASRDELEIGLKAINDVFIPHDKRIIILSALSLLEPDREENIRYIISKVFWNPKIMQSATESAMALVYSTYFAPNIVFLLIEFLDQCFRRLSDQQVLEWMPLLINEFSKMREEDFKSISDLVSRFYNVDLEKIHSMNLWYSEEIYSEMINDETGIKTDDRLDYEEDEEEFTLDEEIIDNAINQILFNHPQTFNHLSKLMGVAELNPKTPKLKTEKAVGGGEIEFPTITCLLQNNPETLQKITDLTGMKSDSKWIERGKMEKNEEKAKTKTKMKAKTKEKQIVAKERTDTTNFKILENCPSTLKIITDKFLKNC